MNKMVIINGCAIIGELCDLIWSASMNHEQIKESAEHRQLLLNQAIEACEFQFGKLPAKKRHPALLQQLG